MPADPPTLADEIAAIRLLLAEMTQVKRRTPEFERHLGAVRAVLSRLLAIKSDGEE